MTVTLYEIPHKDTVAASWLRLTDNDRLIGWLNKTHFSIPDRGLMARTVFWVLCSRSTSSVSISLSPQWLQPTAEQMYRSWGKEQGKLKGGLFYCVSVVRIGWRSVKLTSTSSSKYNSGKMSFQLLHWLTCCYIWIGMIWLTLPL